MGAARLVLSIVVLAGLLGGAGAVALLHGGDAPGTAGTYPLRVAGPADEVVIEADVEVAEATVLAVLVKGAREAGVALELEEYPGMGAYVRAIGPHRAQGASGWIYGVVRDGEHVHGDRSAEFFELQPGDRVAWSWTTDGS